MGTPDLSINNWSLPSFPNFRLGPLTGSDCDTITDLASIKAVHPAFAALAPNPAMDRTYLIYYTGQVTVNVIELYDSDGRLLFSKSITGANGEIPIDVKSLPDGVYMVRFTADSEILSDQKLVVRK